MNQMGKKNICALKRENDVVVGFAMVLNRFTNLRLHFVFFKGYF